MKNAKRNVIVSAILTIALCFSLMIGGTYAWFTDSAKISVNKIVSGTLKVGLNMWDEENEQWVDANGKTLSFIRTDAEDEDNGLWAPGYKFRLPKLQVVNKGNLKLKFKLAFSFNGAEDTKLLEALSFTVKKGDVTEDLLAGGVIYENELLASFETKECEIFGEMKDVMNEYQNLEVRNLAVTLVAIQTNATEYPSTKAISTGIDMDITTPISASGKDGVIRASRGAKVTIDADIKAIESDGYAMAVWADGAGTVVTIKGGYFTQKLSSAGGANSHFDMIYASDGAQIIIEGGTFYAPSYKWTLNCLDNSGAKIILKGGTFYQFDPSDNGVGDGEIEIAEGYHVERRKDNTNYYTVYSDDHIGEEYKKVVYGEGEYDYAIVKPLKNYDFRTAIKKDNNVVLLGGNYEKKLDADYPFGANVIIDCGGYKLTYKDGTPVMSKEGLTVLNNGAVTVATTADEVQNAIKNVAADGKLYLKLTEGVTVDEVLAVTGGDVTIDATDKTVTNTADLWDSTPNAWSLVSARETANVTVRGGNFKAKKDDCYAADVYDKTAKLVIKGGNFIGNITAVYVYEGELVIEGGFFDIQQLNSNNVQDGYGVLINCYDANFKNGTAKVTITGGTFVNFNPADNKAEGAGTNFVPEGYKVVSETKANGDVWYTVVKA